MKQTTMDVGGLSQRRVGFAALVLSGTSGCGSVADVEMFGQSNAALVQHLGEACEIGPLGAEEIVVDEGHPVCEPGYCVGQSGQSWTAAEHGICSCRCDGPEGTGPLCDCGDGFECRALIDDLGGLANSHLVGAYCVPTE